MSILDYVGAKFSSNDISSIYFSLFGESIHSICGTGQGLRAQAKELLRRVIDENKQERCKEYFLQYNPSVKIIKIPSNGNIGDIFLALKGADGETVKSADVAEIMKFLGVNIEEYPSAGTSQLIQELLLWAQRRDKVKELLPILHVTFSL